MKINQISEDPLPPSDATLRVATQGDIPKTYDFGAVEAKWYQRWLEAGCFRPKKAAGKPSFTIVIPPPNVTGVLTMGHVLNNTLQDILIRRARQQGKAALWLPGTDHAGISTQVRVEKELAKANLTRQGIGRERFTEKVVEWRNKHGTIIYEQLKRLGCSCDWEKAVYTLDEGYSRAVLTAFVKLHQRGYIYRGQRMINWCPVTQTALSDEEVIMTEVQGFLYRIRYEIVESPGQYLEVMTTRPETIMGDVAVAVHPEDERYKHLIGKHCWRPVERKALPIIADTAVLPEFGTGALKITPAHDPVDFQIGKRHSLPMIDILNPDGTLNEHAGKAFQGMDRFAARLAVVRLLENSGLLVSQAPYTHTVGFSERGQVPIEPRLSEQWFLRYPKVEEAKRVVQEGLIQFYPERWVKTYLHWLNNIQDWCISRQLWWGHRIPVWYRKGADRSDASQWHVALEPPADEHQWEQDEDVLDTWASSWLWPLATLGWPDARAMQAQDFAYYYPTADLITGPDIIFFWVTRMIIAGLELTGEERKLLSPTELSQRIPFKNVYFTGIIRDKQGRKMSKSLGNSPDPLDLIEKYGADGLRIGIISIAALGQDILFDEAQIEQGRNFCTKLWNVCRYRQMSGPVLNNQSLPDIIARIRPSCLEAEDHWILLRLKALLEEVDHHLQAYNFHLATLQLYTFFWSDFCDWYIEVCKARSATGEAQGSVLAIQDLILRQLLLLLHPFVPFITEELWHLLGYGEAGAFIQDTEWPNAGSLTAHLEAGGIVLEPTLAQLATGLRESLSLLRALKSHHNSAAKRDSVFSYKAEASWAAYIQASSPKLLKLIGARSLEPADARVLAQHLPAAVTPMGTFYLDQAQVAITAEEKQRLLKEIEKLKGFIQSTQARLSNPSFVNSAPPAVIEGAQQQLKSNEKKYQELLALASKYLESYE